MHERAAQAATLAVDQLVCASHVSKTYHFIERSLYSHSTDINFPANPLQKSQKTPNIQKHQKDMKITSEDKTKKTPKELFSPKKGTGCWRRSPEMFYELI